MMGIRKWISNVNQQKELSQHAETLPETTRMVNYLNIIGVDQPEKLAEGSCPNCRALIDLWLTNQGLEMTLGTGEPKK